VFDKAAKMMGSFRFFFKKKNKNKNKTLKKEARTKKLQGCKLVRIYY